MALQMIIVMTVILIILASLIAAAVVYIYKCTHYWQSDYKKTLEAGFVEKQVRLSDDSVINYSEGPNNGDGLLLIHGQSGAWQDYAKVLPTLSKRWHVFAVDCYGHGKSSHSENKYYLDAIGNDLIWFINNIIKDKTVVSGHSSGGLIASYIAAHAGTILCGAVLEDPPVFSTEKEYFTKSIAYQDTYKTIHEYLNSDKKECWESYYFHHSFGSNLFMPEKLTNLLANYAQKFYNKHPYEPVQYFFMPELINSMFLHTQQYDLLFGEHFYNYTWHHGINHEKLMSSIHVPAIFLHAKELFTKDGKYLLAATSNEQAQKAVKLIKRCELVELQSMHNIHNTHPDVFISSINKFIDKSEL